MRFLIHGSTEDLEEVRKVKLSIDCNGDLDLHVDGELLVWVTKQGKIHKAKGYHLPRGLSYAEEN